MAATLLQKLQFKDFPRVYVYNAPADFSAVLEEIRNTATISTDASCTRNEQFAIFFVDDCAAIKRLAPIAAKKAVGDSVLWFAYPKKSSKRYSTDISRDSGWQPIGDLGFEAVRQIAIDDDWSALRFRRSAFIKTLNRSGARALSTEGRARIKKREPPSMNAPKSAKKRAKGTL